MHIFVLCGGRCQYFRSHRPHYFQYNMPVSTPPLTFTFRGEVTENHALASVCAPILIFIEIPFLLRICPTSAKFDAFIRNFTTNYMRAAIYLVMSVVQWLSLLTGASSLLAAAVLLLIAASFYLLAGVKSQEFVGSKTLGGQGLAQMIV